MLNRFSIFVAASILFLIVAGASVTTTGSGLAVPDWPLSFGQVFPEMKGGVFFEHGHRMVATTVGFLTVVLSIWLALKEPRVWVRRLGFFAVFTVILQGVLGGVTVLYGLPLQVSVSHAILGQTFFLIVTTIAVVTSPSWLRTQELVTRGRSFFALGCFTVFMLYMQLFLGAMLRHGGGTAFLHAHTGNAVIVLVVLTIFYIQAKKRFKACPEILTWTKVMFGTLHLQILLGLSVLLPLMGKAVFLLGYPRMILVTAHVALGAFLLASTWIVTLLSLNRSSRS